MRRGSVRKSALLGRLATCFLGLTVLTATAPSRSALAIEPEVTGDTAAQFYDVRSPTGEKVLARRRITSTLGVQIADLFERDNVVTDRALPEIAFRARLRYDADFGGDPAEVDPTRFGQFVPGFSRTPVDLMYGYVEGRRFANGLLGWKLGRQYVVDALGWWSFDGAEVRLTTPYYFAVEGYGGLEVRGGMPLSTPRFERDGIWRGDRSGFDPSLYPQFQPNDVAPAFGAALESQGFTWLQNRLTYRRVYNTGETNVSQFASGLTGPLAYDANRISSERIGYAATGTLSDIGGAKAGFAYDLYAAKIANAYAGLDYYLSRRWTLSLDYDYFAPTFDADSIWNFFASGAMNDVGARANWTMSDHWSASANVHVRMFNQDTRRDGDRRGALNTSDASFYPQNALTFNEGGGMSVRHRSGANVEGARASGNFGPEGDRVGADLYAERIYEVRYLLEARGSLWQWDDRLRPNRDAVSVGGVLGAGYIFSPRTRVLAEFEEDLNRLSGARTRLMLWLSVAAAKP